ncbi:MAG: asparagine synthase (glutamine-hydrolyzing) [Ignavibacteriae bacterium]|nr:asparagine synthase (glutamine-hydrolyzing) [Ignavibacteriota bacterium]
MCGICGILNYNGKPAEEITVRNMMNEIRHRGPDDEGIFTEGNTGLGFVRLSILDLSDSGHQPMHDKSGRYVMIYNGEVYNYIEIRELLVAKGYVFNSSGDSEVVLNSYIEWGRNCLDRFNGMFSLVIYDREKKKLFAARDRFGIKPFYYFSDSNSFIFGSEICAVKRVIGKKILQNDSAIFDYIVFNRTDQTEETFFKEIKKLQHGSYIEIEDNIFKTGKWYNLKDNLGKPFKDADEFRELLSSSIGLRLRSDVPVGVCLSGGLDSSAIVSLLLRDYNKNDINTFSAIYEKEGHRFDESGFIYEYRDKVKNMYFTSPTSDSLINDLDNFIKAHNEPVTSTSHYAQFKVMELAKSNVVVTLDGQGADELLAGYHYFFGIFFKELLKSAKVFRLTSEIFNYLRIHKDLYGIKSFLYFLAPAFLKTKARVNEKGYLAKSFPEKFQGENTIVENIYGSGSIYEALINHFEYKLEHLLKWEDRNSMWYSLEARVPFLDYRFVEKTLSMNSDMKIRKGMTKYLLRESMRNILPEKIRMRKDKIGFNTPEDVWFRTDKFRKLICEIINSDSFRSRGFADDNKVRNLFEKHLEGKINISRDIWKWINLELWFRKFID